MSRAEGAAYAQGTARGTFHHYRVFRVLCEVRARRGQGWRAQGGTASSGRLVCLLRTPGLFL